MKVFLILLCSLLTVRGEVFRVSKVAEKPGVNTMQMRFAVGQGLVIYQVEKEAFLTNKDVKKASVVAGQKGVLEVTLTPEGAKKLAAVTKGADGSLRLAIIVEDVLECAPLVLSELTDQFWISGLEDREEADLKKLAAKFLEVEEEAEEEEKKDEGEKGVVPKEVVPKNVE